MRKLTLIAAILITLASCQTGKTVVEVVKNNDGTFTATCGGETFENIDEEELECFFSTIVQPFANS